MQAIDDLENTTDSVARSLAQEERREAKIDAEIRKEQKVLQQRERLIDGCVFRHTLRDVLASFKPSLQTQVESYYMMTLFYLHRQLVRLCGEEMKYYSTKKIDQVVRKDFAAFKPTARVLQQMTQFEQTILCPHVAALKRRRPKPKKLIEKVGLLQDLITCYVARYGN